jgi:hypothetical protein
MLLRRRSPPGPDRAGRALRDHARRAAALAGAASLRVALPAAAAAAREGCTAILDNVFGRGR